MTRNRGFVFFCALAIVGCGGSKELPRGPVKGRITLGGKAVPGATVVFENKAIGVSQSTTTDDDGNYEFITYNSSGLPAASYKVTVSSGRFMQPGEEIPRLDVTKKSATPAPKKANVVIPDMYAKPETSKLTADVKAGANDPFNFDLKP